MSNPTFSNYQNQASAAIPVWIAPAQGAATTNIMTDGYTQVDTGAGAFTGVSINTGGTTSTLAVYDGNSSTVTITLATPGVISWASHGLAAGSAVVFETTGALPTGMTAGTAYYVSITGYTANSFQIADTKAHALAGTNSIATSVSQSGTQTGWDVTTLLATFSTTAQGAVAMPAGGIPFTVGLIALTASGGAANLTLFYN